MFATHLVSCTQTIPSASLPLRRHLFSTLTSHGVVHIPGISCHKDAKDHKTDKWHAQGNEYQLSGSQYT